METYLQTVRDEWIQLINETDPSFINLLRNWPAIMLLV